MKLEYSNVNVKEKLHFWITEREKIRVRKELGLPKPWTDDATFLSTYFCNVRREDDVTTKGIRATYSDYYDDPMFIYNIVLARFINYLPTLEWVGWVPQHNPNTLQELLNSRIKSSGKLWGNAYVVTTHGIAMGKVQYLCENVLGGIDRASKVINAAAYTGSLAATHAALMQVEGLGSFMAGQIVADLKNTEYHHCWTARDWWTFAAPGPGSVKGMNWFFERPLTKGYSQFDFQQNLTVIREYLEPKGIPKICNQDLQNVLCEFDKMMRVSTGLGRSKRRYPGV